MKKKLVSMLLTAAMVASLVGCGGSESAEAPAETTEKTEAAADAAPAEKAENTEAAKRRSPQSFSLIPLIW